MQLNTNRADYNIESLFNEYSEYIKNKRGRSAKKEQVKILKEDDMAMSREPDFMPKRPILKSPQPMSYRRDMEHMHQLYNAINSALYPVVMEIMDSYEYVGSPVYGEEIDREAVAQMVDRVIIEAAKRIDSVEEIMIDESNIEFSHEQVTHHHFSPRNLLRSVTEALILSELFAIRRPVYRWNNYMPNYPWGYGTAPGMIF